MKNRFRIILISAAIIFIMNTAPSCGQDKVDWTISLDRPELPSTGFRFNAGQFQMGINIGYIPGIEGSWLFPDRVFCFSTNAYYHFAGTSRFTKMHPWYVMTGLTFENDNMKDLNNKEYSDKYTYLNFRAGREFNVNQFIAVGGDIGGFYMLKAPYELTEGENRWGVGFSVNVIIRMLSKDNQKAAR